MTSQSITGRRDFPDNDMLDAMIASALNRLLAKHVHFWRRVSVEEQRAQKYDRFLRWETNCLHDPRAFPYNRSLWSGTRTLSFIQYTFTEWWCPKFRCTVGSSSIISKWYAFRCDPERTVQVKITWSAQRQTVLALYDQETVRNNGQTRCLRLKTSVKLHIDQMMITRTFRVGNEIVERGSVTKSSKGKKACVERKVGECFQWEHMENVPKDTHVVSVMTNLHKVFSCTKLEGQDWRRGEFFFKKNRPLQTKGVNIRAITGFVKNPSCKFCYFFVCENYEFETGCIYGNKCFFRHVEADEKPSKKSKKDGAKDQLLVEWVHTIGLCISRFLSEKIIYST